MCTTEGRVFEVKDDTADLCSFGGNASSEQVEARRTSRTRPGGIFVPPPRLSVWSDLDQVTREEFAHERLDVMLDRSWGHCREVLCECLNDAF
jgi:hypothetical protein